MQSLYNIYKITTTKIIKETKIAAIYKRYYPGGHKLGHAHKILESISNKDLKAPVQKTVPSESFFDKDFTPCSLDLIKQPAMPAFIEFWVTQKTQEVVPKMTTDKVHYCTQKVLALIPSTKTYQQKHAVPMDSQQLHAIQGKESLYHFLKYFEQLPEEFVRDPLFLMTYFKRLTEVSPDVQVRAFQLALEVYLRKNNFSFDNMGDVFDNKFSIEDITNKNGGIADIGTFFSALQANHLYTQPGFKEKVDTCIVIVTCIQSNDLSKLPPDLLKRMEEIRKATGNTVNDILLNGHHYDFKIAKDPYYARNHIMFISLDEKKQNFSIIMTKMHGEFTNKKNILKKCLKDGKATDEEKYQLTYYNKMEEKLNLIRNTSGNEAEKLYEWNKFIYENLHTRPHNIYVPLFIPLKSNMFQLNPEIAAEIKNIHLPPHKVLHAPDVVEALKGPLHQWNSSLKDKAFRETLGVIGEPLVQKEEVD